MKPRWHMGFGLVSLSLVLAVSLGIACGGGGDGGSKATSTAPKTTAPETAPPKTTAATETETATTVKITLSEWAVTGENGGPFPSVKAGEATFEVHNAGEIPHELVVIKTDADPAALPTAAGGTADETGSVGKVDQFPGGETEMGSFTLQAGTYALICNIPGHYSQGMHALLTVQ